MVHFNTTLTSFNNKSFITALFVLIHAQLLVVAAVCRCEQNSVQLCTTARVCAAVSP